MDPSARFDSDSYKALFTDIVAVRDHRCAFLDEIAGGDVSLEAIFERATTDPVIAGMKVLPAMESIPDAGKVQTRRAFEEVGIEESDHIDAVSAASIAGLPEALRKHAR